MKARTLSSTYIPEFFNFKLLIPEYSPIYKFWFQTSAYFFFYSEGLRHPMCLSGVEK
jgi:hypothetical protein